MQRMDIILAERQSFIPAFLLDVSLRLLRVTQKNALRCLTLLTCCLLKAKGHICVLRHIPAQQDYELLV